jgi:hypothetical protein
MTVGLCLGWLWGGQCVKVHEHDQSGHDTGQSWANCDPVTAMSPDMQATEVTVPATAGLPGGSGMTGAVGRLLTRIDQLGLAEAPAVYDAISRLRHARTRALLHDLLLYRWAELDPVAALDRIQNLPTADCAAACSTVFTAWARTDATGAKAACADIPGGAMADAAAAGLLDGMLAGDPAGAIAYLAGMDDPDRRVAGALRLAEELWRLAPDQAVASISMLADADLRDVAARRVAQLWTAGAPADAACWAMQTWSANGSPALREVMHQWTTGDPHAAAAWALAQADGAPRMAALAEIAATWALHDPVATADWLNSIGTLAADDTLLARFATSIRRYDPQGAADWANSIANDAERSRVLAEVLAHWRIHDPAQAARWLSANGLDHLPGVPD